LSIKDRSLVTTPTNPHIANSAASTSTNPFHSTSTFLSNHSCSTCPTSTHSVFNRTSCTFDLLLTSDFLTSNFSAYTSLGNSGSNPTVKVGQEFEVDPSRVNQDNLNLEGYTLTQSELIASLGNSRVNQEFGIDHPANLNLEGYTETDHASQGSTHKDSQEMILLQGFKVRGMATPFQGPWISEGDRSEVLYSQGIVLEGVQENSLGSIKVNLHKGVHTVGFTSTPFKVEGKGNGYAVPSTGHSEGMWGERASQARNSQGKASQGKKSTTQVGLPKGVLARTAVQGRQGAFSARCGTDTGVWACNAF
jgi:hypothetical protein